MKRRTIRAADLFCGAGGTSTGLARACAELDARLELLAINHWDMAIETHSRNHPRAKHLCASLDAVDPLDHVPGGELDLLVASPECTHFSTARGGRPMSNQSRASAWLVLKWAQELYVRSILIENVREFQTWGPLGANGRPLPSKRGETFQAFLNALRSLGYTVDYRVLNAADYGDPTTRERLFIMARRGRRAIHWPEATHAPLGALQKELFGDKKPWRPAREIIDWSIPGESIFRRKRPLAKATMERIAAGLRKFGGKHAEPFLVVLRRHMDAQSIDGPLPTVTAGGQHIGVCEPFVLGQQSGSVARSTGEPLPTVATDGAIALIEPFITTVNHGNGDQRSHAIDRPFPTVTSVDAWGIVEPSVVPMNRHKDQPRPISQPMNTVTATSSDYGLVEPFIVEMRNRQDAGSINKPLSTVTTKGAHHAVVEPILVSYYGTQNVSTVGEPVPTVTTKDRFGLVEVDGLQLDIRFRMLQPHELARAMGFPDDYEFAGNRETKVKQIGNAVPVNTAAALCRELVA